MKELLGTPYHQPSYTLSEQGVNCIGLVRAVYPHLPTDTHELFKCGEVVTNPRPGDMVIIWSSQQWVDEGRPYHYGIVLSRRFMLHASSKRGVEIKGIPFHKRHEFRRLV